MHSQNFERQRRLNGDSGVFLKGVVNFKSQAATTSATHAQSALAVEHILGIYRDSLGASWGKFLPVVHWQVPVAGAHFSSGLALSTVRVNSHGDLVVPTHWGSKTMWG